MNTSFEVITERHFQPTDTGFIYSTWLKGLYYGNDWFREIDQERFFDTYHRVIEALLFKPEVTIKIACLKEDLDTIVGYTITEKSKEGTTLHWAFVKPVWRKLGIAKGLLPSDITKVTHLTEIGRNIKPKGWKFDPFFT